jgi:hypothetical protein
MERLVQALADGLDRRSFFRKLGKVGMGVAAAAAVLLLPRQASAGLGTCPTKPTGAKGKNACWGKGIGETCSTGKSIGTKECVLNIDGGCDCLAI